MKKNLLKVTSFSLLAAALLAMPAVSRAADTTNAPAAVAPKKSGLPFHGKLAAVDTTASTVTVGTLVITITPATKITKDGKKSTLADYVVGDTVGGSYHKDADGKLIAATIHDGKKIKKSSVTSEKTNAVKKTDSATPQ